MAQQVVVHVRLYNSNSAAQECMILYPNNFIPKHDVLGRKIYLLKFIPDFIENIFFMCHYWASNRVTKWSLSMFKAMAKLETTVTETLLFLFQCFSLFPPREKWSQDKITIPWKQKWFPKKSRTFWQQKPFPYFSDFQHEGIIFQRAMF